jgi:fumarate reductase subunit C
MIEDELINIWQSSPKVEQIKFEKSRSMIDVQSSLDRFHRLIKYRDLTELIGQLIGLPVFVFYIYYVPFLLSKIASFFIVLLGIYIIYRFRRVKKHKPSVLHETYLDYLSKSRKYVAAQKRLLETALYWYILPATMLCTIFILGYSEKIKSLGLWVILILTPVIVGICTYYFNQWMIKKKYTPRLKKIDELIKSMEE